MKLSIWSCDSPDFLITPGIRILGTGADTLNSVQVSYFERFHWPILNFWTRQTVEYDCNGTRNNMLLGIVGNPRLIPIRSEREERIGINDGLPAMIPDLNLKLCFILIMINLFDRYLL